MTAQWIWLTDAEDEVNSHVAFLNTFILGRVPTTCKLRIAAVSSYRIWLNGKLLAMSPNTTMTPSASYDIAPALRSGMNTLAVQVHYCNPEPQSGHELCPGLWLEIQSDNIDCDSGESWQCRKLTEYNCTQEFCVGSSCLEYLDLSVAHDWINGELDDKWRNARCMWSDLYRDTTREFKTAPIAPHRHTQDWLGDVWLTNADIHEARKVPPAEMVSFLNDEELDEMLFSCGSSLLFGFYDEHGMAFYLDAGESVTGNIFVDIECESSGMLQVMAADELDPQTHRPRLQADSINELATIQTAPGRNSWVSWVPASGRYLYFVLRGFKGEVRFRNQGIVSMEETLAKLTAMAG